MKILIVGAGNVGKHLSLILSEQGHDLTVIDTAGSVVQELDAEQNIRPLLGNGSSAEMLSKAGVGSCDHFLALTSDDKTNLVACSLAKALGAAKVTGRIHDQTYSDHSYVNYQLHFGIDFLLNPEALSAVELAKAIRHPGRLAVENFARGQIEVQQLTVSSRSSLIGRKLKDLSLGERVRLGYVQQGERLEVATAETVIQADQLVTLVGATEALYKIKHLFTSESQSDGQRVVIFGASETAIALIRLLNSARFKVRVIESNERLCRELAGRFPRITVIHGSATSLRLMEEEQIGDCDFFIACTKDDEDNIMTSILAASLGVRHVQLLINKPDYEHVLEQLQNSLNVETIVSPRIATVNEVLRFLSPDTATEIASLAGQAHILEIPVAAHSPVVGRHIREINWPPGCVLVALQHKFAARVPHADDTLLAGDRIIVIVQNDQRKALLKLLLT